MHSPNALFNLGVMYEYGNGVPLDLRAAMRAYQKAAESNADGAYEAIEALQRRDEWKALHSEG
jgi:TPR repeat protein